MPAEATQVLAQFAASLQYDDIPQTVREHTKNVPLTRRPAPLPDR